MYKRNLDSATLLHGGLGRGDREPDVYRIILPLRPRLKNRKRKVKEKVFEKSKYQLKRDDQSFQFVLLQTVH